MTAVRREWLAPPPISEYAYCTLAEVEVLTAPPCSWYSVSTCPRPLNARRTWLTTPCGEMMVAVNPRNNIDLLLSCEYDFRAAVAQLEAWLERYRSERSKRWATDPNEPPASGM